MNRSLHLTGLTLCTLSLFASVSSAQVNEISSATEVFAPSFRSGMDSTWLGWDEFDDNGSQTQIINDSTPDVGTDFGSIVTNNGEMHISGSLNLYTQSGSLDETVTFPTIGTPGTGFTTVILQGRTLFGPFGSTIGFSDLGGAPPVENVQAINTNGNGQFWVKYEIPGNAAQYSVDMTTGPGGFISLDLVVVDTFWSATDFAPDSTVDTLQVPFANFCNGDGGDQMGCTDCPCGNNAPQGTIGGCLNSNGTSTQLQPSGSRSLSAADLRFDAIGVPSNTPAVLLSGAALAPAGAANPCFGTGSGLVTPTFDGLRCAVQGLLRHGIRSSDTFGLIGSTNAGWGQQDNFFNFDSFAVGQTRYFQLVHRDLDTMVCQSGLNTSQAVEVTFEL